MSQQLLRLMVYDKTDVRRTAKLLASRPMVGRESDPSTIDLRSGMARSWFANGGLYRNLRTLDAAKGFDAWEDALGWLATYSSGQKIAEVQFWGHGSPGHVWMNGQILTAHSFFGHHGPALRRLTHRLLPGSTVWLRTSGTFAGEAGHEFAQVWSQALECRVAGHTFDLGFFQSGLHAVTPDEVPQWPLTEGIAEGTPVKPIVLRKSMPWCVNTLTCLSSAVPPRW